MSDVQMDIMTHGGGFGDVASHIQTNGLNPGAQRPYLAKDGKAYVTVYTGGDPKSKTSYKTMQVNAATLRKDEWKHFDQAIVPIAESRLNGVQDLIDMGLVSNIGNGMGSTVLEYEDISNAMEAEMTIDGITRSKNDRPVFTTKYLPLPIIHSDYEINARVLASSRTLGRSLDTTSAERAARKVSEKLENLLFTATSYTYGGGTIYSYLNHPNRNPITGGTAWTASGKTMAQRLADVQAMKQALIDDKFFGPYILYVPTEYETTLDEDYGTTGQSNTLTLRERILKLDKISKVKVNDTLTSGNMVLVQMTSDVVRLVRGMGMQNLQWQVEGNLLYKFKVMTIQVPQIRADQEGKSGVCHWTTSS